MVRHYETAEEAYATRRELWEARQERERTRGDVTSPVKPVDRYLFDLQGFIVVKVGPLYFLCHSLRLYLFSLPL
eukprot:COSAG04_NODE_114_length_25503_cov_39.366832_4_plen_74_part_00